MDEKHTQEQASSPETNNATSSSQSAPRMNAGTIVTVLVVGMLFAGGLYWLITQDSAPMTNDTSSGLQLGTVDEDGAERETAFTPRDELPAVVATVNGVEIVRETLVENMDQTELQAASQGLDTASAEIQAAIQSQSLEQAINNELLAQAAAEANVEVTAEEVETEIEAITSQFPDQAAFEAELEAAELSLEQLQENVRSQLTINEFLNASDALTNLPEVTEAEARAVYEQAIASGGEGVPSFAEVQEQIVAQLRQQNEQTAVGELLNQLREAADIDILF